ncbi:tripartite tricarboxylate transporter substrate-binding protein [Muricoccus radiodurans]|uniref:tripartite tricarboxylate transporter substrate-binding protein n=1 Tax=Muricoccus radiodurans TaxID=2231721 RepID=UPI003CF4F983
MPIRRRGVLSAPFLIAAGGAAAQGAFPNRTVSIAVPYAAGGPTDVISRLVAEGMAKDLGVAVVAENITGAGGTIAAARVAQARPDGHSLLMHHIGHATHATIYRNLPYNVVDSFAPLGLVSDAAMTIITRPDFPANDMAGFMAAVREQGERLNMAHSGGANQLCGLLVQQAAGANMTPVAFRGSAPAITEIVAGRVDFMCDQATNTVPYIRDRRIKAFAMTLERRAEGLDLPTTAETGFPAVLMSTWHGLYAPAGTPEEIQVRLNRALKAALGEERLRTRFAELVTEVARPEQQEREFHRQHLIAEVERWRPIIRAANLFEN